jgi:hypothetical protein
VRRPQKTGSSVFVILNARPPDGQVVKDLIPASYSEILRCTQDDILCMGKKKGAVSPAFTAVNFTTAYRGLPFLSADKKGFEVSDTLYGGSVTLQA